MTIVRGVRILAAPCCGARYAFPRYVSMNFSAFEYWTDGWRDGSLMPNDEGRRHCNCGRFVLLKDFVEIATAETSDLPRMNHVPDDPLPECIANADSEDLEAAARLGHWRHLNHSYRDRYRQHRDAEEAATKAAWEATNPEQDLVGQTASPEGSQLQQVATGQSLHLSGVRAYGRATPEHETTEQNLAVLWLRVPAWVRLLDAGKQNWWWAPDECMPNRTAGHGKRAWSVIGNVMDERPQSTQVTRGHHNLLRVRDFLEELTTLACAIALIFLTRFTSSQSWRIMLTRRG